MKRFRVMAAALCAAVLLCGFSVPAYAYADGGEGADYGDPTMTAGGNTFYIVIDYDKPVDEEGEQYETYFFSVVDEADLLAAAEAAGVEQAVCSCSEKCAAGAVNTECAVCSVNMEKCVGVEPEPVETEEPAPEEAEPETGGNMGMLLAVLAVALVGGGAAFYFKVLRPKQQRRSISRYCAPNSRKPPNPRRTMAGSWMTMTGRTATGTRTMTARPGMRRTRTERRLTNEVYRQPL